ncbi:unnamed protein product [Arabis nemorensis]|uniref:Reticulon domain-containing protein n=1 Tax=Arabis nemorensis TaxID=586526 RepID=A0A565BTW3_9BRAS|nr:unnamed protein product [Arabis nemorensis]
MCSVDLSPLLKLGIVSRTPPHIPEVNIPEEIVLQLASGLRVEINRGFTVLRDIASGRDLNKFLWWKC